MFLSFSENIKGGEWDSFGDICRGPKIYILKRICIVCVCVCFKGVSIVRKMDCYDESKKKGVLWWKYQITVKNVKEWSTRSS